MLLEVWGYQAVLKNFLNHGLGKNRLCNFALFVDLLNFWNGLIPSVCHFAWNIGTTVSSNMPHRYDVLFNFNHLVMVGTMNYIMA